MDEGVPDPASAEAGDLLRRLGVDPGEGLADDEAGRRLAEHGPNELRRIERQSWWSVLLAQFRSLVMGILAGAAVVAFLLGDVVEAVAISVLIVLNTAIGFVMELRAVRSMEALRRIGSVSARVRRGGEESPVDAEGLVPGDILLVEGGDVVTADARILRSSGLDADESTFTGESETVGKEATTLEPDLPVHERRNMLFKGTTVTKGSGEAVVVATGQRTELGRIAELVATAKDTATPLEERLARLARRLILVTLLVVVVVAAIGVLRGKDLVLMAEIAVALAVAAIPEGLPVVATLALARGMLRMARRNALVRRLSAVETLGSTSVICVDKTGTLTENRMTVMRILLAAGDVEPRRNGDGFTADGEEAPLDGRPDLRAALEVAVLCNNASLEGGDPMEVALLRAGQWGGLRRRDLLKEAPKEHEEAFDPETRMMATVHDGRVAVKGAPEAVLERCTRIRRGDDVVDLDDAAREDWLGRNEEAAADGYRLLALAERDGGDRERPYHDLVFLGLLALRDPARKDVRRALADCRTAGIQVVMVTGDQPGTALGIGRKVGIADDADQAVLGRDLEPPSKVDPDEAERLRRVRVFARVSPEQKLHIIALHQGAGHVVAMTGDGVNDAPALRKADIGVAMGERGTQVAREASDLVLKDDAFPTIVEAVRQGRAIFTNIRRFTYYLLSCNVAEVAVVATAALIDTRQLPLLPLQILYLNLVTDVFPALALGVGEGDETAMRRPPRPKDESFLTPGHWWGIGGFGVVFTASVLGAFLIVARVWDEPASAAVTASFLTLAFGQLWHVFNMRDTGSGFLRNDVVRNPWVWGALALCLGLLALAVYLAPLAAVLDLHPPPARTWALILGASLVPLVAGQAVKVVRGGTGART